MCQAWIMRRAERSPRQGGELCAERLTGTLSAWNDRPMNNIVTLPQVPEARRKVSRAVKAHLAVAGISATKMGGLIGLSQSAMSRRVNALQAFDTDELEAIGYQLGGKSAIDVMQMPKDDTLDYGGVVSDLDAHRHARRATVNLVS